MTVTVKKEVPAQKTGNRTEQDCLLITPESVKEWLAPPFQRPLRINARVHELAETLKSEGGIMPGTPIQLGVWEGKTYLIDGQHRKECFLISGLEEALVKVDKTYYSDGPSGLTAMADHYMKCNDRLVQQRPDDMMRAFESLSPQLQYIRARCPFVGYDQVRRNDTNSPVLSMSATLRIWVASGNEVPGGNSKSALECARSLTTDDAVSMCNFLKIAFRAWGREVENRRLWSSLNLVLCMWLYRRIVLTKYSQRAIQLDEELFEKCLLSAAATATYLDWLVGRNMSERDRSPAYTRLRQIFVKRIKEETGKTAAMPSPPWYSTH